MLTYVYRCRDQRLHLKEISIEMKHGMTEEPEVSCPVCGSVMRRVIFKPEVHFIGPGFASTDHVARPNAGRNPSNQNRYSK